jgi:hypothetical protein
MSCGNQNWYTKACTAKVDTTACSIVEIPTSSPVLLGTPVFAGTLVAATDSVAWTLRLNGDCPVSGTNQYGYSMTGAVAAKDQIPPNTSNRLIDRTPDGNMACWNVNGSPDRICLGVELSGVYTTATTTTNIGPFAGCICLYNCLITGVLKGEYKGTEIWYTVSGAYTVCKEGCMSKWVVSYITIDGRVGNHALTWP